MTMNLNPELLELAKNGKEIFAAFVLPFAVLWLTKLQWKTEVKFAVAVGLSIIAAVLTAIADGSLTATTVVGNVAIILSGAQLVYHGVFKALGLEAVLLPQAGVADKAAQQIKEQVATEIPKELAQEINDSKNSTDVQAAIKITDKL